MGKVLIDMALLTAIIVFVVDLSGVVESIKGTIEKWLNRGKIARIKPFDCPLCMTWWSGLVYLLIVGEFTLGAVALVALFSYLTLPMASLFRLIRDLLTWIINKLEDIIQ